MATNARLRAALLAKRRISPQRLSQLVAKRKADLPMSTEQAAYTIAHESGLDIAKYLTSEETADTRALVTQLSSIKSKAPATNGATKTTAASSRATPKSVIVNIPGAGVEQLPGMSATHAREAADMAKVYALMYVFENSLRDVIERVLWHASGSEWWAKEVPQKIQDCAADRKAREADDPWHGTRGARPIDYVDLSHLAKIIKHHWKRFEPIFIKSEWIESLITSDMNVSRRVVAHMNPLDRDDIKNVENAVRKYVKGLKVRAAEIP